MSIHKYLVIIALLLSSSLSFAQRIVYSEPEKDDSRRMNFEIIGKISGNFLVYKNVKGSNFIAVYNNDMEEIGKEEQTYMPGEKLINVDFFPYSDFSYVIYQYQKKSIVYCEAVKVDGNGKKISDVMHLDTSHIGFSASNKIYSTITSEDRKHLMIFKINSKDKERYYITTLLFDDSLALQKRSRFMMPMIEHSDYLDEFNVDNDGDFVFTKFSRASNETITGAAIMWKAAAADTISEIDVPLDKIYLDEIHLKVDNANKRYFLTSFYYKQKKGNIEGFYFYVWDKVVQKPILQNTIVLSDELRKEAKDDDSNVKMAFNDYFIRNIIIKRDGGFIINTEAYYTTSLYNNWNRWNYLYGMPYSSYDYYSTYSPLYSTWWWRNRYYDNPQSVRHHADNVTILSFDKDGKLLWNDVIHKEQYDDESDDRISYQMANTGGQIHFFFNVEEKRTLLLNDYALSPDGQVNHNPTLKNLDRGYEFLPKYGKQVGAHEIIMPCYFRNYICFAKVDFN